MSAHGSAGRLIGQNAVAVVLNVGDVVKRSQQRARIKNGDNAIRAVAAAILNNTGSDSGDAAVLGDASLQVDDGSRASAMRPENFFAGVGDLHRSFGFARGD